MSASTTSFHSPSAASSTSTLPKRDTYRVSAVPLGLQQAVYGSLPALSTPGPAAPPPNILDRPLNRAKGAEVSMAAWAFLIAEIIAYSQSRVDSVADLEKRLTSLGYEAGQRILSLLLLRNAQAANMKDPRQEHRLIPILQFIHTQVYRYCFGKPADGLERSVDGEDEYMLTLNQPPLTQHISVPKDLAQLSCEAFTAGIVEGALDGLDVPARVTAHTVATDQFPQRTVILIKLDQKVMDREAALGK
ncbi:Trafficking protein particle complex subunit 31 [Cryptotrichosporon argae]